MKNKYISKLPLWGLLVLLPLLNACSQLVPPQNLEGSAGSSQGGSVSVIIPTMNGLLLDSLNSSKRGEGVSTAPSRNTARELMFLTSADIRLYDSTDNLLDSISFNYDTSVASGNYINSFEAIPYGTGYYIEADIYNHQNSDTTPVCSGTSSIFDITLTNDSPQIRLRVQPVNPLPLSTLADSSTTIMSSVYNWGINDFESMGGEAWFQFSPTDEIVEITLNPAAGSNVYAFLYDSTGNIINLYYHEDLMGGISYGNPVSTGLLYLQPGETYNLGIILFTEAATEASVSLNYSEGSPYSPDDAESNDTALTAQPVTINVSAPYNLHNTDDVDYFNLNMTAGINYAVTLSSDNGNLLYSLEDPLGVTIIPDGEFIDNGIINLLINAAETGNYTLCIESDEILEYSLVYSQFSDGNLTLELTDEGGFGSVAVLAYVYPEGGDYTTDSLAELSGNLSGGSFSGTFVETATSTEWLSQGTFDLIAILDMDSSSSFNAGDFVLTETIYLNGNTIEVLSTDNFEGNYLDSYEPDNDESGANTIEPGITQYHKLTEDDEDWLSFTVTEGAEYTIETSYHNEDTDTYLYLYDDAIYQIDSNDDGGSELYSLITWTADYSGTAYIMVREYSSNKKGQYAIDLTESIPNTLTVDLTTTGDFDGYDLATCVTLVGDDPVNRSNWLAGNSIEISGGACSSTQLVYQVGEYWDAPEGDYVLNGIIDLDGDGDPTLGDYIFGPITVTVSGPTNISLTMSDFTEITSVAFDQLAFTEDSFSYVIGPAFDVPLVFAPVYADLSSLTWTVDNNAIASVTDGLIDFSEPGTVTLTVENNDGTLIDTCTVTAEAGPEYFFDTNSLELTVGTDVYYDAIFFNDTSSPLRVCAGDWLVIELDADFDTAVSSQGIDFMLYSNPGTDYSGFSVTGKSFTGGAWIEEGIGDSISLYGVYRVQEDSVISTLLLNTNEAELGYGVSVSNFKLVRFPAETIDSLAPAILNQASETMVAVDAVTEAGDFEPWNYEDGIALDGLVDHYFCNIDLSGTYQLPTDYGIVCFYNQPTTLSTDYTAHWMINDNDQYFFGAWVSTVTSSICLWYHYDYDSSVEDLSFYIEEPLITEGDTFTINDIIIRVIPPL